MVHDDSDVPAGPGGLPLAIDIANFALTTMLWVTDRYGTLFIIVLGESIVAVVAGVAAFGAGTKLAITHAADPGLGVGHPMGPRRWHRGIRTVRAARGH
jgi:hypothetical protein